VCLLRELVKVKGLHWIRPFYLYPQQVTDELLDLYAGEERITKYIDMPLQHINSGMLIAKNRLCLNEKKSEIPVFSLFILTTN
jgi:ribosomal protein S12 methylthiotransferase